jgi:hypothetical protein
VRSRLLVTLALAILLAAAAGRGAPAAEPGFRATVARIDPSLRARMTSWRPGCPVPVAQLRVLTLTYLGFDGRAHRGRLIVHERYANDVVKVFERLWATRFPIRRMELVERYGSDDDRSMAADNTSGFNCRRVPGGAWSEHAYGRAIDVNPLENPEVRGTEVSPPGGAAFLRRSRWERGMIHPGDRVVRAFAAVGWRWGGYWRSLKDYQHFSPTGR